MNNILRELLKKDEQMPDKHDGSYELVRETVKALKTVDEEDLGIEDDPKKVLDDAKDEVNYWWLNARPKIWSFDDINIGESVYYTSRNERGNKRRIYKNFEDVKKGDIVIGYESTPVKAVVAIGQISQEHDGERIWVEKLENLIEPI